MHHLSAAAASLAITLLTVGCLSTTPDAEPAAASIAPQSAQPLAIGSLVPVDAATPTAMASVQPDVEPTAVLTDAPRSSATPPSNAPTSARPSLALSGRIEDAADGFAITLPDGWT